MKIPTVRFPSATSGKHHGEDGPGKGDSPINISKKFKENFDAIANREIFPEAPRGFTKFIYRSGKRTIVT